MERKIGEIFEYDGKKIQVIEDKFSINNSCGKCYFNKKNGCCDDRITGECCALSRRDKTKVIFKLVDMCKNKEEREVKLTLEKAKKWYKKGGELREVALQAFNESELKDNRSHTWEEFCQTHNQPGEEQYWYIDLDSEIGDITGSYDITAKDDRNLYPTKKYAEAARALAQLLMLRQEWVGDWEPKWEAHTIKYCIVMKESKLTIEYDFFQRVMSFPTEEMAKEFLNDFNDLLWEAKLLL